MLNKTFRWRIVLAAALLACMVSSVAAQDTKLFEGVDTVWFYAEISGQFNRQSAWNINLVNAPQSSFQSRPKDMEIPQKTLDLLNANAQKTIYEVLDRYQVRLVEKKKKEYKRFRERAKPIFTLEGDRYFRIDIVIAGDNGLGGHYGGLDVQMYFKSLHRNTNLVYGYSFRTVTIGATDDETLANLHNSFSEQLKEAYDDWKESLAKDLNSPRRYLILHFEVNELNPKQQKFVRKELFPCLYAQGDSLGYIDLKNFYYQIFYRLRNADQGETEESFITRYAELLQFSMGSSAKYRCSLWKTPLENYRTTVKIDSAQKLIKIGWRKSE